MVAPLEWYRVRNQEADGADNLDLLTPSRSCQLPSAGHRMIDSDLTEIAVTVRPDGFRIPGARLFPVRDADRGSSVPLPRSFRPVVAQRRG